MGADAAVGFRASSFKFPATEPFSGFVSAAAVSNVTPARLFRSRGHWALEVTRLVPLDDKVLVPRSQRLEGTDAILRQLRHLNDQSGLAHGAAQLMRALRGDDDRSFVVIDGEWVPSADAPARPSTEVDPRALLSEVRAELLLLRASHQRLRERVAALEARLERLDPPARAISRSEPPARLEPKPLAFLEPARAATSPLQAAAASEPPVDQTRQSAGVEPEARAANPFREAAAVLAPESTAPAHPIALPPAARVLAAITELFGSDSGLAPASDPLPDSALELAALYAGRFVNDEGSDLGALLAELRLVAHIGGKLMGLPSTVVEEQARTGLLNDQVLAAIGEVVNVLSSTVNEVAGNPHVRGTPVEPFPADRLHWVGSARERVALSKSRVGTLWLVAR